MLLPPVLGKRHFYLSQANRVGMSILEAVSAAVILGAVAALGYVQLKAGETNASGNVAQVLWFPLFVLILYRSPIAALLGVSMERSMFWHGLLSLLATAYSILHGIIALYHDDNEGKPGLDAFRGGLGGDNGVYWSGVIASGLMALIILTSAAPIRRVIPRIWLYSHHVLPLAAAVVSAVHGAGAVLAAVAIYVAARLFGYIFQAHVQYAKTKALCSGKVVQENGMVRITAPRTFSFSPGQYVGISCPAIAWFEWHNFTIASAPSDSSLVLYIKADGKWTMKLLEHVKGLGGGVEAAENIPLPVLFHGPVGSVAIDWTSSRYEAFLVFGGGVGITPILSFYRELASQADRGRPLKLAQMVYTSRSERQAHAIIDVDAHANSNRIDLEGGDDRSRGALSGFQIDVYITGAALQSSVTRNCQSGISSIPTAWHSGRPDISMAFAKVAQEAGARGLSRIGVLACGPED